MRPINSSNTIVVPVKYFQMYQFECAERERERVNARKRDSDSNNCVNRAGVPAANTHTRIFLSSALTLSFRRSHFLPASTRLRAVCIP